MRWALVVLVFAGCEPMPAADAGVDGTGTDQALVTKCLGCHALGEKWALGSSHSLLFDCSACHAALKPSGRGHVTTRACAECHSSKSHRQYRCVDCHDVHGSENLFLMRPVVLGERIELTTPVLVNDGTGTCEVCHTNTAHYRRDLNGTEHTGAWCITCHSHGARFAP